MFQSRSAASGTISQDFHLGYPPSPDCR